MAHHLLPRRPLRTFQFLGSLSSFKSNTFRFFSTEVGAREEAEEEIVEAKKPTFPAGYNEHIPPRCDAWDLTCPSWKAIDRENTLISNWRNPEDSEDFSRITIDEESFTDFKKLDFNRMHDNVKQQMFDEYSENPMEWTVAKLATKYGVSQPRVQAILLLKEWEKKDIENGVTFGAGEELEDMIHASHLAAVKEIEDENKVKLESDKYSDKVFSVKTGPTGKFRILRDNEGMPVMPDLNEHVEKAELRANLRRKTVEAQEARHLKIKNKRWTYVIKDTTEKFVR